MHIAVIPARKGSVGFKFKNRKFFKFTADFIKEIKFFDRIIVSTDDPEIVKKSNYYKFEVHKRPENLAGPAVAIKSVFNSIVTDMKINDNDIFWLFYLPILYKNKIDFKKAREIIEQNRYKSLCSFVEAKVHPYNCWKYDKNKKILNQYIKNNIFRRQDLPDAWMHYHYLCCFYASELKRLNNELINENTYPFFLNSETSDNLIEIDTPEDYKKWIKFNKMKGLKK